MCTKKTKSDTPGHSKNEYEEEEEDRISDRWRERERGGARERERERVKKLLRHLEEETIMKKKFRRNFVFSFV